MALLARTELLEGELEHRVEMIIKVITHYGAKLN